MTDHVSKMRQLASSGGKLAHYGVKGMKWGVRRDLASLHPSERAKYVKARDAKWLAKVEANPKLGKISAKAARESKKLTKKLKADYKKQGINLKKDALARSRYDAELKNILEQSLDKASYKVHKFSPTRLNEVAIHRHPDGTITAIVQPRTNAKIVKQRGKIAKSDAQRAKEVASGKSPSSGRNLERLSVVTDAAYIATRLTHADLDKDQEDDFDGLVFVLTVDEEGFADNITTSELGHSELQHHGIKGMKWGIRRTDAQLAKDIAKRKASGEEVTPTAKAKQVTPAGEETAAARYARLTGEAKGGGAKNWSEQDLKFYNARTEALAKVDKMFSQNPSWLASTSKKVLQQAAQNTMQSVADGVAKKYITTPILDSIPETKKK